jgi:hypothetical protein
MVGWLGWLAATRHVKLWPYFEDVSIGRAAL